MSTSLEECFKAELGMSVFGVVGGKTDKLAAMKAQLLKRSSSKKLALFDSLGDLKSIRAAIESDKIVAIRCNRDAAMAKWESVAELCARRVRGGGEANAHVGSGSAVAMAGDVVWCLGGWRDQRDVVMVGAALVSEAKRRNVEGRRDYFVARPKPVFSEDERRARLEHLFPSVPERHRLEVDEEAAYSVSNESSAAKVVAIVQSFKPSCVVDATACVGGNAIAFARTFQRVYAIEIDQGRFDMLKNNLQVVNLSRVVTCVKGNCIEELPKIRVGGQGDEKIFVFADPPWGGRHYKFQTTPDVHLKGSADDSNLLTRFVRVCAAHPDVSGLALKLPANFDKQTLFDEAQSHDTHIISNQVHILVLNFLNKKKRRRR